MPQPLTARVINLGVPAKSLDAVGAAPVNGTPFLLPNLPNRGVRGITWRMSHAGGPSAVNAVLQGTMLNPDQPVTPTDPEPAITDADWFVLDTSTVVGGEQRTVLNQVVKAVRIRLVSRTGGTTTTGEILAT